MPASLVAGHPDPDLEGDNDDGITNAGEDAMEEPAGAGDDGFANGAEKGAHVSPGLGKESGPDGVWSCWRRDTG